LTTVTWVGYPAHRPLVRGVTDPGDRGQLGYPAREPRVREAVRRAGLPGGGPAGERRGCPGPGLDGRLQDPRDDSRDLGIDDLRPLRIVGALGVTVGEADLGQDGRVVLDAAVRERRICVR